MPKNKHLLEVYQDYDTVYIIFDRNAPEITVYTYAYKAAITRKMKVGNLIYRDGVQQITLTPYR